MSTASSRVRGLLTCQCRHRPSTNWRSILKPRRQWASQFLHRYLPAPMRSSNKGAHVRYWPKADMPKNAIDVAIGGKADIITIYRSPVSYPELRTHSEERRQ